MGFYTSPSFFLALAVLIVPAAVLGLTELPLARYGFVTSCLMLLCLFAGDARSLAAFGLFLAVASAATWATYRSWGARDDGGAAGLHDGTVPDGHVEDASIGQPRAVAPRFKLGDLLPCKSLAVYRLSLAATIAPLVVYKVAAVFDANLLGFMGISYVTFKAVQVLIEVRDGLITDLRPFDYLYFLVFFPPFTSGPIDRSRRFGEDLAHRRTRGEYADLLTRGVMLLLVGAVMQLVLATMARGFFDPAAAPTGTVTVSALGLPAALREVLRAYGYAAYLFFDFAGYSLMAMGASYCFGIATPRNFRAPFIAVDIKDFWNRWHITLSTWLRDFVFMRFVRAATKRKLFANRVQTACAGYLVNMLLMGAWHGLTADYLAYGVYHGALLAGTEVYQKRSKFYKRNRKKRWYKVLSWFVTLQLVVLGFALFSGQVGHVLKGVFNG